MEGEESTTEKVVNFRLATWIKKEVFDEFQKFAKERAGNKYETAIQLLMDRSKILDSMNLLAEKIAELEQRVEKVEGKDVKKPKVLGGEEDVKT